MSLIGVKNRLIQPKSKYTKKNSERNPLYELNTIKWFKKTGRTSNPSYINTVEEKKQM